LFEKIKFLGNLLGKIEIVLAWIHDPQISNQIDAAAIFIVVCYTRILFLLLLKAAALIGFHRET